jgi:hypothetical protein
MIIQALLASAAYFLPPQGWEIAQPKEKGPLQIGFIGEGAKITLAIEEEAGELLKEYVMAVKKLQMADPSLKGWREIGGIGNGRLIEMTSSSAAGEIKIVQAIFLEEGTAYILTGSALKKDFGKVQAKVFKSFESMKIVDKVWDMVGGLGECASFAEVQKEVKKHSDLGLYWEFLALQEGVKNIRQSQ